MNHTNRLPSFVSFVMFFVALFGQVGLLMAAEADFSTNMPQAKVFFKKGWYREAVKELRMAISTSEGKRSFEAHLLLSESCYKEMDIGCALNMADKARSLASSIEHRQGAQNMLDYLQKNFGKVEFVAREGEPTEGYLELEIIDPIVDSEVKKYYKIKVTPLANQRRTLPWVMYLPTTTYRLYGQEFTVEGGGNETSVFAGFTAENSKQKPQKLPPEEVEFRFNSALTSGFQMTLGDASGLRSQPDVLLTAAPLRFGVTRVAAELHLVGGINTTSSRQVVPVLAVGPGIGGYESLGPVTFRWSAAVVAGLGAVSVLCGPESGIPEQVTLTCGLDDGFAATIQAPWFGPKVELGASWRLGPVDLGLSAAFLGEFYQLTDRKRILNVSGVDGREYEIPYLIAGGDFKVFLPALVVGPTARFRW